MMIDNFFFLVVFKQGTGLDERLVDIYISRSSSMINVPI